MSSAVLAITDRPSPSASCMPAASLAPPVPPARTTQRPIPLTAIARLRPVVCVGEAGDPDPRVRLVAAVDADQHGRQRLDDPRLFERARVDRAQAIDQLDHGRDAALVGLLVAADQDVLVERLIAGQDRGAHGVEGREDGDTIGRHLLGLLGSRALPDADGAGRFARDRGGEGDGAVDQQLALGERFLQVGEGLGLSAERHGEEDDRASLGGFVVWKPFDLDTRHGFAQLRGGLLGALRLARADHDRLPGARQSYAQAIAERAGAADYWDWFCHRRASYTSPRIGCRAP